MFSFVWCVWSTSAWSCRLQLFSVFVFKFLKTKDWKRISFCICSSSGDKSVNQYPAWITNWGLICGKEKGKQTTSEAPSLHVFLPADISQHPGGGGNQTPPDEVTVTSCRDDLTSTSQVQKCKVRRSITCPRSDDESSIDCKRNRDVFILSYVLLEEES